MRFLYIILERIFFMRYKIRTPTFNILCVPVANKN